MGTPGNLTRIQCRREDKDCHQKFKQQTPLLDSTEVRAEVYLTEVSLGRVWSLRWSSLRVDNFKTLKIVTSSSVLQS